MKTKVLIAISIVAVPALMLTVFSGWSVEDGTAKPEETFVERAVRTRLNADIDRSRADNYNETILERATRTRASELVDRVNSKP